MINLYNISKIQKSIQEERSVLRNVNLSINRGDFVAITGPSGSGKSTIMNIISLIERPTYGRYVFETVDVSLIEEDEITRLRNAKVGVVFQSANLIPELTVKQNIEIPLIYKGDKQNQRNEKVVEMLQRLGLSDLINRKPLELSKGQQQLIAIGRALLNNPILLILDEPTGALDSITTEEILLVIQKINASGVTVVLVTSDIEIAKHAKRVVCFKDGIIVKDVKLSNPINSKDVLNRIKN